MLLRPESVDASSPLLGACPECLRRTRLFELLAPHVEHARHERRLGQVLALGERELLGAIAGRRRPWFESAIDGFDAGGAERAISAAGLTALCRHDPRYPPRLLSTDDAPAVLHLAGDGTPLLDLVAEGAIAVAVVGARRATGYGLEIARGLGRGLAAAGIPVVSGMALGVDAAAHAGALEVGGPTIAVLAGGADLPYPPSKAALYRRIVGSVGKSPCGCAVSEMPPGFRPFKWGFPARNRIIAALADATIVVEAAQRSGSLITAELAQELGRIVAAVPGPVSSPMSTGTNAMLRDGAELVRDAQDVLDTLLGPGVATLRRGPDPATLAPALRAVLARLGGGPATPSALLRPEEDVDALVAGLSELELLGFVRRGLGGAYVQTAR